MVQTHHGRSDTRVEQPASTAHHRGYERSSWTGPQYALAFGAGLLAAGTAVWLHTRGAVAILVIGLVASGLAAWTGTVRHLGDRDATEQADRVIDLTESGGKHSRVATTVVTRRRSRWRPQETTIVYLLFACIGADLAEVIVGTLR